MTLPPSEILVNLVPTSRRPGQTSSIRAHSAGDRTLDPIRALTTPSGVTGLALSFQTGRAGGPQGVETAGRRVVRRVDPPLPGGASRAGTSAGQSGRDEARPNSVDDLMTVQMDLASRRADQWVLPPDDVVPAGCFGCF